MKLVDVQRDDDEIATDNLKPTTWYKVEYWTFYPEYDDDGSVNKDSETKFTLAGTLNDKTMPIAWDCTDEELLYPNGYANEIVTSFETYIGIATFNPLMPISSIIKLIKYGSSETKLPQRKKVNPKE